MSASSSVRASPVKPSPSPADWLRRLGLSASSSSTSRWAAVGVGAAAVVGLAAAAWAYQQRRARGRSIRPLHWVFKVGDLERTVDFYTTVLGLTVQRHEEFDKGCEATCNGQGDTGTTERESADCCMWHSDGGAYESIASLCALLRLSLSVGPYSGWWSKTMMSYTTEEHFSIELTYNYGVSSYRLGNDLAGIHVHIPGALQRARAKGIDVHDTPDANVFRIVNPDGQAFFLHEEPAVEGTDPFLYVSLHSENVASAVDYYTNVLGMIVFESTESATLVGYSKQSTKIQLVQLPQGSSVDHADSFGRIAFGNPEVERTYERVVSAGDAVINPPIRLETPGKASVVVSILRDRDGNEICMVNDDDFRALCRLKPGDELINWTSRRKRIAAQQKFTKTFGGGSNNSS
jgi:predicted enzyme related to lactoylglutathione lyase